MKEILAKLQEFEDVGFYAQALNEEKEIKFNENKIFLTASTSKIITAIALYHKLEAQQENDNLLLKFTQEKAVAGSGIMKLMKPATLSLHNLLVLMLTISDNSASDLLVAYVTKDYQRKVIDLLGLKDTHLRQTNRQVVLGELNLPDEATQEDWNQKFHEMNFTVREGAVSYNLDKANVATPADFLRVLKELVNPTLISKEHANKILFTMKHCYRSNFFADLSCEIAHKTGGIPTVSVDVGIVFAKNPFFFIMMAKNAKDIEEAMQRGKEISKLTHEYFNNEL